MNNWPLIGLPQALVRPSLTSRNRSTYTSSMGSLTGHLIDGVTFTFLGVRWLYSLFLRYFLCRREASLAGKRLRRFQSALVYPWSCAPWWPMDGVVISAVAAVGMCGEVVHSWRDPVEYPWLMDLTHLTMQLFVLLFGVAIILRHFKALNIPNLEYYLLALTMFVETFSFQVHVIGRSLLEAQVHSYAAYTFAAIGALTLLEAYRRSDLLLSAARNAAFILLGTWFLTLGFVLFPQFGEEPWDQNSVKSLKMMMMMFLWNLAGVMLVSVVVMCAALLRVRCMGQHEMASSLESSALPAAYDREEYLPLPACSDDEGV